MYEFEKHAWKKREYNITTLRSNYVDLYLNVACMAQFLSDVSVGAIIHFPNIEVGEIGGTLQTHGGWES